MTIISATHLALDHQLLIHTMLSGKSGRWWWWPYSDGLRAWGWTPFSATIISPIPLDNALILVRKRKQSKQVVSHYVFTYYAGFNLYNRTTFNIIFLWQDMKYCLVSLVYLKTETSMDMSKCNDDNPSIYIKPLV
jgi:hypothetical protein